MPTLAFLGGAHIHTPGFIGNLKDREGFSTKWFYDHDLARAEARAATLEGAQATDDLNAVLSDPEVEAVVICSETDRHEELVKATVAAGKHLFVEKPLGFGAKDAREMANEIEKAGLTYQTGYFSRGIPALMKIKELVDAGAFGKITRVRGSNCHSGALGRWFDTDWRWMADPKIAGCGAFGDLGTHSLDILLWIFGDVKSVTGQIDVGTNAYDGCDETGEAILRFESGAIGTLAAAWDDVANPVSYLVSGTEGHAAVIGGKLHLKTKDFDGIVEDLPEAASSGFGAFLDALEGKSVSLVTASEAARRSEVMAAIYEGATQGTWVTP
ncbi:Gfo/Idh/MocA family oxidoreductase [bacterium]|nr:MAG: Gfo/Idh/MocA family oxidoreductase [bacterium]